MNRNRVSKMCRGYSTRAGGARCGSTGSVSKYGFGPVSKALRLVQYQTRGINSSSVSASETPIISSSGSSSATTLTTKNSPTTTTKTDGLETTQLVMQKDAAVTAIAPPVTILNKLPKFMHPAIPYLELTRVDKPIGTLLLYWPCAWSITLSALTMTPLPSPLLPLYNLALFLTGAFVMRGAGCTINDMWDARLDRAVDRTKSRPLARGAVSMMGAWVFLAGQLCVGLAVLLQLNWYSIFLGASSLALVCIYPFMKRVTYYPQIVLGLAFNWGALLGWSAMVGHVDWALAGPLYLGGTLWCVFYDTIYAHQDKKDDILVNIKSTALRFGAATRPILAGLGTAFVSSLAYVGHVMALGPVYHIVSVLGTAVHLCWQLFKVDFDKRASCWKFFVSNGRLGGLIWAGMWGEYLATWLGIY